MTEQNPTLMEGLFGKNRDNDKTDAPSKDAQELIDELEEDNKK
jgi:hypothetical protein